MGKPRVLSWWTRALVALGATAQMAKAAIQLDANDPNSFKAAASVAAHGMVSYYHGNETGHAVGVLDPPYYWWETGAMFMSLIQYWYFTGDESFNEMTIDGMLAQIGPNSNFMPPNQTKTEGNDDQAFWAFAALTAAELKFPDPPSGSPSWLALAQAVFNFQTSEWDSAYCNGGLRWQIFAFNNGYNLKNSISNGGYFQLAARLAVYTRNQTYADWAQKVWDWSSNSPLINMETWQINDNTGIANNCTTADQTQWTYNYGTYLMGAAYMYNYTNGSSEWGSRISGILNSTGQFFFPQQYGGDVMSEISCEVNQKCNYDQPSFKAYLSSWMAFTTQMAPFTTDFIMPKLKASAQGAAGQCSGGSDGVTCGRRWYQNTWDGMQGVGEEMSAMSIFGSNLIPAVKAPVTSTTGGTSKSNPAAGAHAGPPQPASLTETITTKDRAGAGILTALVLGGVLYGAWWISSE